MNYYLTQAGVKFINELDKKGIEQEWGEFKRVAHEDRRGVKKQRGSKTQVIPSTRREMAAARKGRETTTKSLKGVENTDATDIKNTIKVTGLARNRFSFPCVTR